MGLPWQLRPMLTLTPTTLTATDTATTLATITAMDSPTDTATDTATSDTPMPLDTTMARGLLMPSPLLMLMPTTATPLWLLPLTPCPPSTEALCTDSPRSMAVSTATTMARDLRMPRLLLKLMPMPTTTTGMPTTATVSTMATLLDTMDTPATTDIPTCTTATATPTDANLLIFVKN